MDFSKPVLEYAELWPMLVIFGVAMRRRRRRGVRPARAPLPDPGRAEVGGLVAALGGSVYVAMNLKDLSTGDQVARGVITAGETLVVDGPTTVLWVLVLIFALGGVLLFAERRLEGGVSAFAGQAAALPGTEAEREASTQGLEHTEVYPAADVRRRRHDAVPRGQRPADHVRRARGALAAALPALRPGPPPAPAQPGGRAQVLPPRRVLLRLLPLRRRADLRLRRVDELRGHQRGGSQRQRQPGPAADRHGHAGGRPAVQGRRSAVPVVDARRLPGRAHRGHRRSWLPAPRSRRSVPCCASSTSPSVRTAGAGSR